LFSKIPSGHFLVEMLNDCTCLANFYIKQYDYRIGLI
jgi:hypothetical protein